MCLWICGVVGFMLLDGEGEGGRTDRSLRHPA